jgi:hypothetical protein
VRTSLLCALIVFGEAHFYIGGVPTQYLSCDIFILLLGGVGAPVTYCGFEKPYFLKCRKTSISDDLNDYTLFDYSERISRRLTYLTSKELFYPGSGITISVNQP